HRQVGATTRLDDDVGGSYLQLSATRHGVPRVDAQVHDDLLQLPGVDCDAIDERVRDQCDADVLPDRPAHDLLETHDLLAQIEHGGLRNLFPAEREEVPGEGRRT